MGFHEDFAKIIKEAREKRGLTQVEVAKKAKIHFNYYAQIERGKVKARGYILNDIAHALGIKIKLPLGE